MSEEQRTEAVLRLHAALDEIRALGVPTRELFSSLVAVAAGVAEEDETMGLSDMLLAADLLLNIYKRGREANSSRLTA